ncbi:28S ribosomal protein S18c, mitochondrial [Harpegnathos saltator]|uniref:28S ribosomal protein S18c, mitochondrial n=2 Tax=Harpegnathos saltator TaxID=610380 RepID=E2B6X5_HARSA|nr:28S ribosomal protein S18c, mitochondrial [Harpegnathos saltator]
MISKSSVENSTESNVAIEDDMPVQLENPYVREKQQCILCKLNIEPDYKNVRLLSQFQSRYTGRIYEKHITGLCEYKQKRVQEEITKAQCAGLMGFMSKKPEYVKDPQLFDPNHPFKPHPF